MPRDSNGFSQKENPNVQQLSIYINFLMNKIIITSSSYFELRRLRTIFIPIFTSIVHAFICTMIDNCNSLMIGLPKTRLSPLQTVLDATVRLIARLLCSSHISSCIKEHWLPISTRIEYKVLLIVVKAQLGVTPKYL